MSGPFARTMKGKHFRLIVKRVHDQRLPAARHNFGWTVETLSCGHTNTVPSRESENAIKRICWQCKDDETGEP